MIHSLIQEALNGGEGKGATSIIDAIGKEAEPLNHDGFDNQEIWFQEFGQISHFLRNGIPMSENVGAKFIHDLSWFLSQLQRYKLEEIADKDLAILFEYAAAFRGECSIWSIVPSDLISENLTHRISNFIAALKCSVTIKDGTPIWQRETTEEILKADKIRDWVTVENLWRTIVSNEPAKPYLLEAVSYLCQTELGLQNLAETFDSFDSILPIVELSKSMTASELIQVARFLKMDRARYCFIQRIATRHPKHVLSEIENGHIISVFQNVQKNPLDWKKWMKAINSNPVRFLNLQEALGLSLVKSSVESKLNYIRPIKLHHSPNKNRQAVTNCLSTFAKKSTSNDRKSMWKIAWDQWLEWDFGKNNPRNHLTWMPVSPLDFGIYGYLIENLNKTKRKKLRKEYELSLFTSGATWHHDKTSFNSNWYRALGRWQVLMYSEECSQNNQEWHLPKEVNVPFNPTRVRYFALSYPLNLAPQQI